MKPRIGLLLSGTPAGGGTFQYNLAMLAAVAALAPDRFQPFVVYTHDRWASYLQTYQIEAVRVRSNLIGRILNRAWLLAGLSISPWRRLSPQVHTLARSLVQARCDLWVFPSQDVWGYAVPVPALVAVHDLMHLHEQRFPELIGNGRSRWRREHYANVSRWSTGVLVDSAFGKQDLVTHYPVAEQRVHVLPFVVPEYILSAQPPAGFEQRYQLPPKYIFYPAQFWEHKNHKRLVEAAALLRDRQPDLQLVFVGAPQNGYESLLGRIAELQMEEHVQILGYVPNDDMAELYRRARALVMPTLFGPTNIPPLEAINVGCPVAVSRIYAMPEQLGDAALYFDPHSVAEIAATIERLWQDDTLCTELRQRGFVRAQRWTQTDFNQRVEEIITTILTADIVTSPKHVREGQLVADQ